VKLLSTPYTVLSPTALAGSSMLRCERAAQVRVEGPVLVMACPVVALEYEPEVVPHSNDTVTLLAYPDWSDRRSAAPKWWLCWLQHLWSPLAGEGGKAPFRPIDRDVPHRLGPVVVRVL